MKRDLDIVRNLLLAIEAQSVAETNRAFAPSGFVQEDLEAHMPLLIDRQLIEAKDWSTLKTRGWGMVRLTWEGHDFLDSVRDPEVWRKTKEGLDAAGGFTFELMKSLAKGLVKKKIEKHTGIELDL